MTAGEQDAQKGHGVWFSTLKAAHECLIYGFIVFWVVAGIVVLAPSHSTSLGDGIFLAYLAYLLGAIAVFMVMILRANANKLRAPIWTVLFALVLCIGGTVFYVTHGDALDVIFGDVRFVAIPPDVVIGFLWVYTSLVSGFIIVQSICRKVLPSGLAGMFLSVTAVIALFMMLLPFQA